MLQRATCNAAQTLKLSCFNKSLTVPYSFTFCAHFLQMVFVLLLLWGGKNVKTNSVTIISTIYAAFLRPE